MGTPLKVKSYHSTKNTMPCGVHLVFIQAMKGARDNMGNLIGTEDGEMAIDICFENKTGQQATQRFWTTAKAMWMLENLCKAVGVNIEGRQASKKEMLGKQLWLLIGAKYNFENGDLVRNGDGSPFATTHVIPKFYPVLSEDVPPMLQGDPAKNNGIPGGDFLLNTDLDIEHYWEKKGEDLNAREAALHDFNTFSKRTGLKEIVAANPGRINIMRLPPNPNAENPFKPDAEIKTKGVKVVKTTESKNVVQQFNDEF